MSSPVEALVRSVRGDARPARLCPACGTLLGPGEPCDGHPGRPTVAFGSAEWAAARQTDDPQDRSHRVPDWVSLLRVFLPGLGVLLLFLHPYFAAPEAGLIGALVMITLGGVAWLAPMLRKPDQILRRRAEATRGLPPVSGRGVVQSLDGADRWVGYAITCAPLLGLTASDGWVEELLLELGDGRRVVVPAGRARIVGGEEVDVNADDMEAVARVWLEAADTSTEDAELGGPHGYATLLSAGARVRLHSPIEPLDEEEATYRTAARFVVRGVPVFTPDR